MSDDVNAGDVVEVPADQAAYPPKQVWAAARALAGYDKLDLDEAEDEIRAAYYGKAEDALLAAADVGSAAVAHCVECGARVKHRLGAWWCPTHRDRCTVRFAAPPSASDGGAWNLRDARAAMCSEGGRQYVEKEVLRPFGYRMASAASPASDGEGLREWSIHSSESEEVFGCVRAASALLAVEEWMRSKDYSAEIGEALFAWPLDTRWAFEMQRDGTLRQILPCVRELPAGETGREQETCPTCGAERRDGELIHEAAVLATAAKTTMQRLYAALRPFVDAKPCPAPRGSDGERYQLIVPAEAVAEAQAIIWRRGRRAPAGESAEPGEGARS